MLRWLFGLTLVALLALGVAYVVAGRGAPPGIVIDKPDRVIGQAGTLDVTADAPRNRFTALTITLEQNGRRYPLYALNGAGSSATVTQVDPTHTKITRPLGKQSIPELKSGAARILVSATRPSFLNLRQLTSIATRDVQVRLEPPRIAVLSTKHYVNHGGSEMVVYKATPPEVASGVRVGEIEYPGFPASGAGVEGVDASIKVAFFGLLHDQDLNTRIQAFARDEAGNEAKINFVDNVFEKPFKQSRIQLDDKFINRVVPEILEHAPELKLSTPAEGTPEMLQAF